MPSPVRDRKFSITSALSITAHTEGATPNNRVACGLVNVSPVQGADEGDTTTIVQTAIAALATRRGGKAGERVKSGKLDVFGTRTFRTLPDLKRDRLPLLQGVEWHAHARALMEEILGAILCRDESEPPVRQRLDVSIHRRHVVSDRCRSTTFLAMSFSWIPTAILTRSLTGPSDTV